MKLLSIAIPCYNSEAYMRHCIESLLPGGDEVEILIVDDGSTKDRTAEIADEYERKYPGTRGEGLCKWKRSVKKNRDDRIFSPGVIKLLENPDSAVGTGLYREESAK